LLTLGRENGWDFEVLGRAPMLPEPVRVGDWMLVPAHEDSTLLPDHTMRRLQAVFEAGIRPEGFVLAHEVTQLLPAPAGSEQPVTPGRSELRLPGLSPELRDKMKVAAGALGTVALGTLVVAGVVVVAAVALAAAAALAVPAAMATGAVVVDPILIAVTSDGYWIEIDRWDV
jgi:hypothetical protein